MSFVWTFDYGLVINEVLVLMAYFIRTISKLAVSKSVKWDEFIRRL